MNRLHAACSARWSWTLLSLWLAGCSLMPGKKETAATAPPVKSPFELAAKPAGPAVKISYRTAADRLNVAAAGVQLVSYQQQTGPLPAFTTATLAITSPHPQGLEGMALATVVVKPDATPAERTMWQKMTGAEASPAPATTSAQPEAWVLDIPQAHVDAVAAKIRAANFFQRSRLLTADVYMAAEIGSQKMGKECKALPELDAMILRVRLEGRRVTGNTNAPSSIGPHTSQPVAGLPSRIPPVSEAH